MKVLVIGGTGIIGGAITEASVMAGHEVTVLTRSEPSGKWKDISARYVRGDWYDDLVASEVVDYGFDVIIDTLIFNEEQMARSVLIADGHCRQLIYISTDSVYARPASDLSEDKDIILDDIHWEYGIGKRKAELYLQEHGGGSGLDWTVIRPVITFGDTRIPVGFASKRGTYDLISRIENGWPVLRFDDHTRHALCHVSVFGRAVTGLFLNEKSYGNLYHISDDVSYTYDEIFDVLGRITGRKPVFAYLDAEVLRKYDTGIYEDMIYDKNPEFTLDNTKIKSVCPDVDLHADLEEALLSTVTYLRENRKENEEYGLLSDLLLINNKEELIKRGCDPQVVEYIEGLTKEQIRSARRYGSGSVKKDKMRKVKDALRPIKRRILG
ncbi:MAG: NAD-dependent epimerase/dehydratase family protein [Clostridiales bacterium]|nr:NAD-dependent epimerase/dehydratase family protein [Clostridiales bacterium]